MSALEENILTPVTPDNPCGPNLEYDAAFVAFERALLGRPEQQIGSTIIPAEPPVWRDVQSQAVALLSRSKDLRAACALATARLQNDGFPGFVEGLAVVRGLLERYWEGLHPHLDPEDDNDPTMRLNVLAGIADPAVLTAIRTIPMVTSRAIGRFSLRDLELAAGPADATTPGTTVANIEAALMDCDLATLEATTKGARACVEALSAIEAAVANEVGTERAPDLSKPKRLLKQIADFLQPGLSRRQFVPVTGSADGQEGAAMMESMESMESTNGTNGAAGAMAVARYQGEITSRDDVIRALEKICGYYARFEPSSPVPMLIERCKRLVFKNFLEIVRDLAPDAMSQVEILKGPE